VKESPGVFSKRLSDDEIFSARSRAFLDSNVQSFTSIIMRQRSILLKDGSDCKKNTQFIIRQQICLGKLNASAGNHIAQYMYLTQYQMFIMMNFPKVHKRLSGKKFSTSLLQGLGLDLKECREEQAD
jgi:hypothetical protein|tara:strand:+ start:1009 stop:1389 length:381 start_codon:yes stop_codon:yes gene_type:complete